MTATVIATTNALTTFNFNTSPVSVIEIDGQPWFAASDVCRILGLTNATKATASLEPSEKTNLKLGNTRGRSSLVLSRSGVFALAMKSRKPEAREFRQWVTGVVLPSIQDNGGYIMGQETIGKEGGMTDEQFLAEAALVAQRVIANTRSAGGVLLSPAPRRISSTDSTLCCEH